MNRFISSSFCEDNYDELCDALKKWNDLFTRLIIDENEEISCLAVIEKVIDEKSELRPAFRNIIECFKEMGIVSKIKIDEWKQSEVSQYKTLMDGVIRIRLELHDELKGLIN